VRWHKITNPIKSSFKIYNVSVSFSCCSFKYSHCLFNIIFLKHICKFWSQFNDILNCLICLLLLLFLFLFIMLIFYFQARIILLCFGEISFYFHKVISFSRLVVVHHKFWLIFIIILQNFIHLENLSLATS
jgi:hypothetical protein